jgi:hypothetical protein
MKPVRFGAERIYLDIYTHVDTDALKRNFQQHRVYLFTCLPVYLFTCFRVFVYSLPLL